MLLRWGGGKSLTLAGLTEGVGKSIQRWRKKDRLAGDDKLMMTHLRSLTNHDLLWFFLLSYIMASLDGSADNLSHQWHQGIRENRKPFWAQ